MFVQTPTTLYISKIVEGSSFNKAVEICNPTGTDISLDGLELAVFFNGNTSPNTVVALSDTLTAGESYVVADDGAVEAILDVASLTTTSSLFNGDDAIVLRESSTGTVLDSFGQVGLDPGSEWLVGGQDDTLVRIAESAVPDTNPNDTYDGTGEWTVLGQNDFTGLGDPCGPVTPTVSPAPTSSPTPLPVTLISEIQGSGSSSPLTGKIVKIQGIVTGDFQEKDADTGRNLRGFFMQEEDADADGNAATSEGIFVFDGFSPLVDVSVGDFVEVVGTVAEFFGASTLFSVELYHH